MGRAILRAGCAWWPAGQSRNYATASAEEPPLSSGSPRKARLVFLARPRRKEPRAAVRLSLPIQVQARVTEGKGGERGKETPNPPCPAPLHALSCPPSSGARRHPRAVGATAAGKGSSASAGYSACGRDAEVRSPGGRAGIGGCSPGWTGGSDRSTAA